MTNKLCYLVDILENNENCVILKVKDDKRMDLIKLGYFEGDEDLIRLTKGKDHTCTIFKKDNSTYSWDWGRSGYTLVSDATSVKGRLIEKCITEDFDIYIGENLTRVKETMSIKSLDDVKNSKHFIELMYWGKDGDISVHKDGAFYERFKDIASVKKHFRELNYDMTYINEYTATTGCIVEEYNIAKTKELDNASCEEQLEVNEEMVM